MILRPVKITQIETPMKLAEGDIILIDSLYGLYPPLTDGVADNKINLYIEPLMQVKDETGRYVRWTDIRLMRRMLQTPPTVPMIMRKR